MSTGFMAAIFWFVFAITMLALIAKILQMIFRLRNPAKRTKSMDGGIVRSALALLSLGALVLLAVTVVRQNQESEAQTLMLTAVVAIASAASAFYFSSRVSETARKDLLSATLGRSAVAPQLEGQTIAGAQQVMSALNLRLKMPVGARAEQLVKSQDPAAGTVIDGMDGAITVTVKD
ncbi:PASTA domain-containing protein [Streptomyces sp. NBC_00555]|uniref:PASTA domain-containing protein n=1 Tax=Streptomyces sp. NBC_00555 TaxID=2903662 RepID=UPI002251CA08|nr:PASTA domain-containing protein [Streptomyces sp. NBC_00555]MCX5014232.1 PASTA domain-containing protein [Streptomyces sp. NBC_00555]